MRLLAALCLCLCLLAAPALASPVGGLVRDPGTGAPVASATVRAPMSAAAADTTGADGAYELDLPDGTWDVELTAPGRVPATIRGVVVAGGALLDVPLAADGAGSVLGGVISREDDGAPIAGARVRLRGTEQLVVTAGDGLFRFEGLPDGRYVVEADGGGGCFDPGFVSGREGVEVSADAVDGERGYVPADVALAPDDPADNLVLCGTVRVTEGGPGVPFASVLLHGRSAISGADGGYVVRDVEEGHHDRTVARRGHEPAVEELELTLALFPDGHPVIDAVIPPALTRGTATGFVGLSDNPRDRSGSLVRIAGAGVGDALTGSAAEYSIEGLPAGLYVLTASHAGYGGDGADRLLVRGESGSRLDVALPLLSAIRHDLAGVVRDAASGAPIFDALVRLDDETTSTAEDGSFAFLALTQGTHRLVVSHVTYEPYLEELIVAQEDLGREIALLPIEGYVTGSDDHRPGAGAGGCGCGAGGPSGPALLLLAALLLVRRRR